MANAAGLGPIEMNVLTECWVGMPLLSYTATRGWPEAAMRRPWTGWKPAAGCGRHPDRAGRAARASLEDRTDAAEQPIVAALGSRLDEVCARLDDWGARCMRRRLPGRHPQTRGRLNGTPRIGETLVSKSHPDQWTINEVTERPERSLVTALREFDTTQIADCGGPVAIMAPPLVADGTSLAATAGIDDLIGQLAPERDPDQR